MTDLHLSTGHGLSSYLRMVKQRRVLPPRRMMRKRPDDRPLLQGLISSSSDKSTMGTADRITLKETGWQNFTLQPYKYVLSCPRAMKKVTSQTADRMTYIYIYMDEITDLHPLGPCFNHTWSAIFLNPSRATKTNTLLFLRVYWALQVLSGLEWGGKRVTAKAGNSNVCHLVENVM